MAVIKPTEPALEKWVNIQSPEFAVDAGREVKGGDETGLPWTPAPSTSHLEAFRFYDRRKFKLLKRSEIHVRFKATPTQPRTEYRYYSTDDETFTRIFAEMQRAHHPGIVLDRRLKRLFDYTKI